MPETSNVARRYAQGAFRLATEEKAVDAWREELAKLDELLADDVLKAAFKNPAVGLRRRIELAKLLAPELRPQTQNLLRLLIEHGRTSQMPAIRREFERLADEAAGVVHARVTTAIQLSDEDRQTYEGKLAQRLGRKVDVTFQTDPAIIGGAAIQVGDHLIDGSIRTQLDRLHQDLLG